MPTVYPTAAGTWSTRTWNNDATGAAYGGPPLPGDIVLANGLAITINIDITVDLLRTSAGTTAAAGGSFTTSGTRIVNANSEAGTTNCLILAANSNSVQNGSSYGSQTTNTRYGTTINSTCVQNGNSTGGNGTSRTGTLINNGGIQNGDATAGSGTGAHGTIVNNGGELIGDSYGDSTNGAVGVQVNGGVHTGNSTGGSGTSYGTAFGTQGGFQVGDAYGFGGDAPGTFVGNGGILIGKSWGGGARGAIVSNGIHFGDCQGGSISGEHATEVQAGGIAIINTATGNTAGAFGVIATATARCTVLIATEVGVAAKSLNANTDTTDTFVPFINYGSSGGSASSILSHGLSF